MHNNIVGFGHIFGNCGCCLAFRECVEEVERWECSDVLKTHGSIAGFGGIFGKHSATWGVQKRCEEVGVRGGDIVKDAQQHQILLNRFLYRFRSSITKVGGGVEVTRAEAAACWLD